MAKQSQQDSVAPGLVAFKARKAPCTRPKSLSPVVGGGVLRVTVLSRTVGACPLAAGGREVDGASLEGRGRGLLGGLCSARTGSGPTATAGMLVTFKRMVNCTPGCPATLNLNPQVLPFIQSLECFPFSVKSILRGLHQPVCSQTDSIFCSHWRFRPHFTVMRSHEDLGCQ